MSSISALSPSSSSSSSLSSTSYNEVAQSSPAHVEFKELVSRKHVSILTGTSAWWGSMPKMYINNILTHKDLDPYVPGQYNNIRILVPDEEIQAANVSEVFRKVKEDTARYGREFDQSVQQALGDSPDPDSSVILNVTGDRYLRAKIHESRHSEAIKKHLDSTGRFPTTYAQPKSEWWWG